MRSAPRTAPAVSVVTIALWLTESLHGFAAWKVALASTAMLWVAGFLRPKDWLRIDWSTLLLVAGGIVLGRLLEQAGVVPLFAAVALPDSLPAGLRLAALCGASALLAFLKINGEFTAAAENGVAVGLSFGK